MKSQSNYSFLFKIRREELLMKLNFNHKIQKVIFCFLFLIPFIHAFANDGSFQGKGATVFPVKENRIKMVSEDIRLELKENSYNEDPRWHVDARYLFENPTNETITLQVGFPEYKCDGDTDCKAGDWSFYNLTTNVRGKFIAHRVAQATPNKNYENAGRVHLFDVTFKPRERVSITHNYFYKTSSYVDGKSLRYVTKTGALWNGPIGKATFTIIFPFRPFSLSFHESYKPLTVHHYQNSSSQKIGTKIIFQMNHWTPTEDLHLVYNGHQFSPQVMFENCPSSYEIKNLFTKYNSHTQMDEALSPQESLKKQKQLFAKIKNPALCRNLVYAIHGYSFKNPKWNNIFYKQPSFFESDNPYTAQSYGFTQPIIKKRYKHYGLSPNPFFSMNDLSTEEKKYTQLLKKEEERRAKYKNY